MKCITGKICYKDRLDAIIALSRIQEKTKKLYKKSGTTQSGHTTVICVNIGI